MSDYIAHNDKVITNSRHGRYVEGSGRCLLMNISEYVCEDGRTL
jgi:hypothetical protein